MTILKAIIYTRVSTNTQAEHGTGLEVQESACLRKAQELKAEVVDIISDEGVSGALFLSRPGIQKALNMLEAKQADIFITMKLDRSGRDADVLAVIRKRIHNAGAQLVFADGANFENNATGNLLFRVNAGFVEYEKEVIRERTMSGRRKRAEQGQQPTRSRHPFGYHIVCKDDVLRGEYPLEQLGIYQVIEDQAKWARMIFVWYAEGASLRQVCRNLLVQHVPTPQGGEVWKPGTIKIILANPIYKGMPIWGKKQTRFDESRLQKGMLRAAYVVTAPETNHLSLSAPALVDAALWEVCQERVSQNQSSLGGNPERRFLLSGLLRCPKCGRSMSGENSKGYRYYNCTASRTLRAISGYRCLRAMLRADAVENLVLVNLNRLAHRPERFASALRTYALKKQEASATPDEADQLRKQLAVLKDQEAATVRLQIDAEIKGRSLQVYDEKLAQIDLERKTLTARLARLEAPASVPSFDANTEAQKIAEVLRRVETVLLAEELSAAEKHLILSKIIKAIHPKEDGYSVELLPSLSGGLGTGEYISIM